MGGIILKGDLIATHEAKNSISENVFRDG